jgi:hypothetical protein
MIPEASSFLAERSPDMTKERTARKRGHKNEVREHQADPTQQGLELPNHPNFDGTSEESTPTPAAKADERDA